MAFLSNIIAWFQQMNISYTFSITDLVQAIGVGFGSPATIWSVIQLFRRNNEQEEQLNSLRSIATSQNTLIEKMTEQITELAKHTAQFEYQTVIFKESNELLREQINIQTSALLNDKDYKEKYLELERKKQKLDIMPFFKPIGGTSYEKNFSIRFTNLGKRAYFEGIQEIETKNMSIKLSCKEYQIIEENQSFLFTAEATTNIIHNLSFEFNLLFTDQAKNRYKQNIKGTGINAEAKPPSERVD